MKTPTKDMEMLRAKLVKKVDCAFSRAPGFNLASLKYWEGRRAGLEQAIATIDGMVGSGS